MQHHTFIIQRSHTMRWGNSGKKDKKCNGKTKKTKYIQMLSKCEKMFVIAKIIQMKSTSFDLPC